MVRTDWWSAWTWRRRAADQPHTDLVLKKLSVPAKAAAPLLVGVGLLAAAIIQYPLIVLIIALLLYLLHMPYAVRRYRWLANHPEAWDVPPKERRAIRRNRTQRRLGLRKPQFRKVAGAARRAVMRPRANTAHVPRVYPPETIVPPPSRTDSRGPRKRHWRRLGLRQNKD